MGVRPRFCILMSPLSSSRKHLEAFRGHLLRAPSDSNPLRHPMSCFFFLFQTLPPIPTFFSHLLTLPFSHVNTPVITISCASVAPCVCGQIVRCKAIRLSEWFPSVNKSRAVDRKAAMGIWLIHSAHFVKFNMKGSKEGKEQERSKSRNERRMSDLGGLKTQETVKVTADVEAWASNTQAIYHFCVVLLLCTLLL